MSVIMCSVELTKYDQAGFRCFDSKRRSAFSFFFITFRLRRHIDMTQTSAIEKPLIFLVNAPSAMNVVEKLFSFCRGKKVFVADLRKKYYKTAGNYTAAGGQLKANIQIL